jgi:thioredoxin reductase/polyferredoxin
VLQSGTAESPLPEFDAHHQTNIPGIYVIGDLAGAPVIKLALEQGFDLVEYIAALPDARSGRDGVFDLLVVGAGASGLNALLQAQERGLTAIALEKSRLASTIEDFPEGKWVYAEPDSVPAKGKLWLDGATKEDLLRRWNQIVVENHLEVRCQDGVRTIKREGEFFRVTTDEGKSYQAKRVVLAIGRRGNPRQLGVPGEDREEVMHQLYAPKHYEDEDLLVVGGGNSAVEAALLLSEKNRVVLSYRGEQFARLFKDNERKLKETVAAGRLQLALNSNVEEFAEGEALVRVGAEAETQRIPCRHAFVLIGAELPLKFLSQTGIRLEGEWTGSLWQSILLTILTLVGIAIWGQDSHSWSRVLVHGIPWQAGAALTLGAAGLLFFEASRRRARFAWLGVAFLICYTIYGVKLGSGQEFWPFRGWGYRVFSFGGRPWTFWYTVLYTTVMSVFGIKAMKKWGFDRKDRYQILRYSSLIGCQWLMFFIVPEFLFQLAVKYQWVGEQLANNPQFTGQAWRAYGLIYAWPLFFYTFFYDPHQVWVVWGVFLTFVLLPVFAFYHGKRYCTWVCGCGGLAETLGDRWRVLAPKGKTSRLWERMNSYVLAVAFAVTAVVLLKDAYGWVAGPADRALTLYKLLADVWLVGIVPVTLYPFLGGKVWCRYWCPLAKMLEIYSHRSKGRFRISANDKCIACYECSRHCQVGIPVMQYALKQEDFGNWNTCCIGCGICVTVCPMDVLSFGKTPEAEEETQTPAETSPAASNTE